jgi:multidrug efflux pump subunit AcrA (membrane-fusion protein)
LAKTCFCRHQPIIKPNIYTEVAIDESSAELLIKEGNEPSRVIEWREDRPISDLRRISMFDHAVATIHGTEQTAFGFRPAGFDVFTELAGVYHEIQTRLDSFISTTDRENEYSRSFLEPQSKITQFVERLGSHTNLDDLRQLATFSAVERARLEQIDVQIASLRANRKDQVIAELVAAENALAELSARLKSAFTALNEENVQLFQTLLIEYKDSVEQAAKEGVNAFSDLRYAKEFGSKTWREFLSAAHSLASTQGPQYPQVGDPCLLCNRPLDQSAKTLIDRFWTFISGSAIRRLSDSRKNLSDKSEAISAVALDGFDSNSVARLHILRHDPTLAGRIGKSIESAIAQRDAIKTCLTAGQGNIVHIPLDDVTGSMTLLSKALSDDRKRLEENDDIEALRFLEAEHVELRHRQVLSQFLGEIERFIRDKTLAAKARAVRRAFTTRPITDKETELFSRVVTGAYRERFLKECALVNCHLPVSFQTVGRIGETRRYLEIEGGYRPKDILSEGEQKAVALADFLTEVALNPTNAGIILDDPVTSLDHERKQLIAKRLVQEALERQVIIFTHDLVFMSMLLTSADDQNVSYNTHWVERSAGIPGHVRLNDSPASSKEFRTTTRAKASLQQARDVVGSQRVSFLRQGMGELRRTIEEVVQHHLFKEVVGRWRENIMITRLKQIVWDNEVVDELDEIFSELSRFMEGHSHSDETHGGLPEIGDLEGLIQRMDVIIGKVRPQRQ